MSRGMQTTTPTQTAKPAVKEKDRDPVAMGKRDAAFNRSASFNYFLTDKYEAGVQLRGTEVKSIREGKANLKDAYGLLKDGECFLLNAHIGPFSHGNADNHESLRTRKLLLHQREIDQLVAATKQKGYTLIPVRLYFPERAREMRDCAGQGQAGVRQAGHGAEAGSGIMRRSRPLRGASGGRRQQQIPCRNDNKKTKTTADSLRE